MPANSIMSKLEASFLPALSAMTRPGRVQQEDEVPRLIAPFMRLWRGSAQAFRPLRGVSTPAERSADPAPAA
jgi:hypothetical protein